MSYSENFEDFLSRSRKITELTPVEKLSASDYLVVVSGGVTKKTTIAQLTGIITDSLSAISVFLGSLSGNNESIFTILQNLSANWQSAYTTVLNNSGDWDYQGTDLKELSANWQNTFTTVQANSAEWDYQGTDLKELSANWQSTYTTVLNNSGGWNYQGTDLKNLSANWQSVYTTVLNNSAEWDYQGTDLKNLSGNWQSAYTTVLNNSAEWDYQGTDLKELSANWQSAYTTVLNNSGDWDYQGTDLKELSANWQNTFTTVQANSAEWDYQGTDLKNLSGNWQSVYTTVLNNSGDWDYQGTDLKELSGNWQSTYTTVLNNSGDWNYQGTDLKNLSGNWQSAYTTVLNNSGDWNYQGTDLKNLSGNWQSAYTTVLNNSAVNWNNDNVKTFILNNFLPLSGGTITGNLSVVGDVTYLDTTVAIVSTMFIDTTSVETALRITQKGSGDIIRVEDSPNLDNTPFIINSNGFVGIGTANPNQILTVAGNISATGTHSFVQPQNNIGSPVLTIVQNGSGDALNVLGNIFSTGVVFTSGLVVSNQLYYSPDDRIVQLSALSGNYDENQFFGKIKLTQNNNRLINIGNVWLSKGFSRNWNFVSMSSDGKYQTAVEQNGQIYISSDYGNTWVPKENNRVWNSVCMSSDGKYQTAVVLGDKFYISLDYGNTWIAKGFNGNWISISMSSNGKRQTAVAIGDLIYISSDYGNTWVPKDTSRNWSSICMSSDGKYQTAAVNNGQIYISSDYGNTWVPRDFNRVWTSVCMSSDGKYQTATVNNGQIYISFDYGNTWVAREFNRDWTSVCMSSNGKYQTAVVDTPGQIYISLDYGNTWTPKDSSRNWYSVCMSSDGKYQTAVVQNGQIYISIADELIAGGLTVFGEISTTGSYYGDGSNLTGIIGGDTAATTLVRSNSANWQSTYTTVLNNSGDWDYQGTDLKNLSANWQSTYTTVLNNSASWINTLSAQTSEVMLARVYNAETFPLVKGNVVYTFGATGDTMSVKLASNISDDTSSKTLGFVNGTIAVGGIGYVVITGQIEKMSLPHQYFSEGDTLWLGSTPGSFTNIKPIAPNHGVYLGVVERANNGDGLAYVKVQNGYELDEIHDVLIATISAGDVLRRNSTNNLWINTKDGNNWDSVYTTVQSNSAVNWNNEVLRTYAHSNFVPISGGTITGNLSVLGDITYLDTSVSVTSAMFIDTTSTETALRITQRGSGDVIRVEDSANPDSTPFIINGDGLVGIGTTAPTQRLTVSGNISATNVVFAENASNAGYVWNTTSNTQAIVNKGAYGNGMFLFPVFSSNAFIKSEDGVNWKTITTSHAYGDVCFGNGLFIALAYGSGAPTIGRVYGSINGEIWSPTTLTISNSANNWSSITYGNGLFVAVSYDGTNRVMTSPDGITWTERTAAEANSWQSVTYGNGLFVAVAGSGTNRVMTSPDGITWTARTAAEANLWSSIAYGNGLFVAVTGSGTNRVMTSPDGITWTARTAAEANQWSCIAYGNGLFVAVSSNGTNRVMTSPDGITWTARSSMSTTNALYSIVYGNQIFVAGGVSGPLVSGRAQSSRETISNIRQGDSILYGNYTVAGQISSTSVAYVSAVDCLDGVILKSPNNSKWKIFVTDTGGLSTISI